MHACVCACCHGNMHNVTLTVWYSVISHGNTLYTYSEMGRYIVLCIRRVWEGISNSESCSDSRRGKSKTGDWSVDEWNMGCDKKLWGNKSPHFIFPRHKTLMFPVFTSQSSKDSVNIGLFSLYIRVLYRQKNRVTWGFRLARVPNKQECIYIVSHHGGIYWPWQGCEMASLTKVSSVHIV